MAEAGMVGGLPNWNVEPSAGVKLAPEVGGAPKRKGGAVEEAVVPVSPLRMLGTPMTPKPKADFEAESVVVLAVVTEATWEVAVASPGKAGTIEAGFGVCWKGKGVAKGMGAGGPGILQLGMTVGVEVLVKVLEDAVVVTSRSDSRGPPFSLSAGTSRMDLNLQGAESPAGAVGEREEREKAVLSKAPQ